MKVISLGLGLQSTAMYFMSSLGELPRADVAIFADLGAEKSSTYAYLSYLLQWRDANMGVPLMVIREKNLYQDLLYQANSRGQRFASIPAYTRGFNGRVGMLRRECTQEYKVFQIDKVIRRLQGLSRGQRTLPADVWVGITIDEADRMSEPLFRWKTHVYPFTDFSLTGDGRYGRLGWGMVRSRSDLHRWYEAHGLRVPEKSGCVFCPYRSNNDWLRMKTQSRPDFDRAVVIDHAIRDSTTKGIRQPAFVHKSLMPLERVQFDLSDLWNDECTGYCQV